MLQGRLCSSLVEGLRGPGRSRRSRSGSTGQTALVAVAERLESRLLLTVDSVEALQTLDDSAATGEKPQSKVWEHGGHTWAVLKNGGNMDVLRLDGDQWNSVLTLTSGTYAADIKVDGNVVHVLLEKNSSSKLASLQYVVQSDTYTFWSQRPGLANVPLPSSAETATIDIDSTGRMWTAYDNSGEVEVRYSDGNYSVWSDAIVIETGIASDDIVALTALPNRTIGVMWSNQKTERFGFRTHADGAAATNWSADEVPGSQSALDVGGGMADDHINLAVSSTGTLYAAVKTSYDSGSTTTIGLLVRSPQGTWSDLYDIDDGGTRPTVQISETTNTIIIAYRRTESSGPILYSAGQLSTLEFGSVETLIEAGSANNVSGMKANFANHLVLVAGSSSSVYSVRLRTSGVASPANLLQNVLAGVTQIVGGLEDLLMIGSINDEGLSSLTGTRRLFR